MSRTYYDLPEDGPPFHARVIVEEGRFVRAWSKQHISLSPTRETRKLRKQLRKHLPGLKAEDSSHYLCAEYGVKTVPRGNRAAIQADVENNLFYNVGLGAFAASARFGLRFQKVTSFDREHFLDADYYYGYTLIPGEPPSWRGGPPLLVLQGQYSHPACHKDWSTVWLAIKESTSTLSPVKPISKATFGLSVELRPPENAKSGNLAGMLKPIFDGVICALHHDEPLDVGGKTDAVAEALRKRIKKRISRDIPVADLRKHLLDNRSSLLGGTPLVRALSKRLQMLSVGPSLCRRRIRSAARRRRRLGNESVGFPGVKSIKKIVSSGQTGAGRAALDFAIEHHLARGGWCPKGRLAKDGVIDARYSLQETSTKQYLQRTEQNVIDSMERPSSL